MKTSDFYLNLIALLGRDEQDSLIAELTKLVGESPAIDAQRITSFYEFRNSGILVLVQRTGPADPKQYVHAIVFLIDVPDVRNGYFKSFSGQFMREISTDDSKLEVQRKMNFEQSHWFADSIPKLRYDFPDHKVEFDFSDDGTRMVIVGVNRIEQEAI